MNEPYRTPDKECLKRDRDFELMRQRMRVVINRVKRDIDKFRDDVETTLKDIEEMIK